MPADRFAYIDRSMVSFVVGCDVCRSWACVRLTLREALEAKAGHDARVHGDGKTARDLLTKHRRRHAAG